MTASLTKLTVKGFKSIRELNDFDFSPLNILIGANGAGKSNFVSALSLLQSIFKDDIINYVAKNGWLNTLLYQGKKQKNKIFLSCVFNNNTFSFNLRRAVGDRVNFSYKFTDNNRSSILSGNTILDNSMNISYDFGNKPDIIEAIEYFSYIDTYHFNNTSWNSSINNNVPIHHNEKLYLDGSNLAAYLYRLEKESKESKETFNKISDTIKLVAPFFKSFSLRPNPLNRDTIALEWLQKVSVYTFQANQLSDGTLRFMCLATLLLQPTLPSIVIIDEPEIGLHPYALGILAEMLESASKRTQIIVSTQSSTLINFFQPKDIIVTNRKDCESTFHRLNENDLQAWLEEYSVGDLWEKNIISGGPVNE